jgi:hypothetical protein
MRISTVPFTTAAQPSARSMSPPELAIAEGSVKAAQLES